MQFRRKEPEVQEPMDLDSVMKKYDQESNTRIWEGKPKIAVTCILAVFSLFCLYVTLFASWLEEWRLTSFVAGIVLLGFLVYPARKGVQRVNHIPWYDIVMMVAGTGAFLYFTFNAMDIIQQGSRFAWYQIVIGIVGIVCLAEVCRRSVGLPILVVAGCFLVYALIWGLSNPTFTGRVNYAVRYLFYSKEGVLSTPINVCSKFIIVFIIFGAFLERTGIADLFMDIANALVGRFSGGPNDEENRVFAGVCRRGRGIRFYRRSDHAANSGSSRISDGGLCGSPLQHDRQMCHSSSHPVLRRSIYQCPSGSKKAGTAGLECGTDSRCEAAAEKAVSSAPSDRTVLSDRQQ